MTDSSVTWNDERVELLKKLWAEGRSASQIAAEIGGVSRNAVIGKVHRLGLSGRAKVPAATPARQREKAPAAPKAAGVKPAAQPAPQSAPRHAAIGSAALAQPRPVQGGPAPVERLVPVEAVVVPLAERVTIMDLREGMCRWPMGDPSTPEFRFCGARAHAGATYCDHHAQMAYQPSADRRRDKKVARG